MPSPSLTSGLIGAVNDQVALTLGSDEVRISLSYEVVSGVIEQPDVFSLRLGSGDDVAKLIASYPPNTPFKLHIGGVLQMTGRTNGIEVTQDAGATNIAVKGRSTIASLYQSSIQVEKNLPSHSYAELVQKGLDATGFLGTLVTTNDDNRTTRVGVNLAKLPPVVLDTVIEASLNDGLTFRPIQARVKQKWAALIKKELDRGGLFLWSAANGDAVLSRPRTDQPPVYAIKRTRGQDRNTVNVLNASFRNEDTGRFSEVIIYGRYGGKKYGRAKAKASAVDPEMQGWGIERVGVLHDVHVANQQMADFLCKRKIAETRRNGWSLQYVVAGHTTQAIAGIGRATWAPDTMVYVQDDEFGLNDLFYLESCRYARGPETTTTLNLMRPADLLFGLDEGDA